MVPQHKQSSEQHVFSGNVYIFQAFDVGDDIDLDAVRTSGVVIPRPHGLPKYFKNYHTPLTIELPHPHSSSACISVKLHNFGTISLTYKIPFEETLQHLRQDLETLDNKFQEMSVIDCGTIYKKIKPYIKKAQFFHMRSSYVVIQIDPEDAFSDTIHLKETFGGIIVSALRFETETLSEYQKNEILDGAIGYFRGDLIVIDTEAAFLYDTEYEELIDLFEFANIQHLELRYFDRVLDQQLNIIYEGKSAANSFKSYLPFVSTLSRGSVDELGKLRVDISVITERLESSIKLVGEPYFSELYNVLADKLDLQNWKDAIHKKLEIIKDIRQVWQHKVDSIREDMLTVLIIILIFIELVIGLLNYLSSCCPVLK